MAQTWRIYAPSVEASFHASRWKWWARLLLFSLRRREDADAYLVAGDSDDPAIISYRTTDEESI